MWSRKGDRIYYWNGAKLLEVPVELEPTVRLEEPRELFSNNTLKIQPFGRYTVVPTANPDRFLIFKTSEQATHSHVDAIVVQNWPAEFAKKRSR